MDGTLIDSMFYWNNLAKEFLESKGIYNIPQEVIEKIEVMTMSESAQLFIKEFKLLGTKELIVTEMNNMINEHYKNDIPLKKGVKEYLDTLYKKGVKMCVASATAEHLMKACLSRVDIMKYFEFVVSCESVGVGKHKADIYFEAIKRLKSNPYDTAVYEDALYAVTTAKKAGFYVVGVYDDNYKKSWKEIEYICDEIIYEF